MMMSIRMVPNGGISLRNANRTVTRLANRRHDSSIRRPAVGSKFTGLVRARTLLVMLLLRQPDRRLLLQILQGT
jgi:hypothetical protein